MMEIKTITEIDIDQVINDFKGNYLSERKEILEKYKQEQIKNKRHTIFVFIDGKCAGYSTLYYKPKMEFFAENNIPEIMDLNIMPNFRNKGLGATLIKELEKHAVEKDFEKIGIGVGLYPDYGQAQRLYVKLGYIPTGEGIFYDGKQVKYGESIINNDSLTLYFTKKLKKEDY